jgi:hypothetical protein
MKKEKRKRKRRGKRRNLTRNLSLATLDIDGHGNRMGIARISQRILQGIT